tara:strand:+ start:159 stop:893 length:735 start_codon:yes stop_codon:yes gene_type:complete
MFKDTETFIKDVRDTFRNEAAKEIDISRVEKFPLNYTQCFYVVDWQTSKIIFNKNVENILGYSSEEFTLEKILTIAHPDDFHVVKRLTQAIVNHLVKYDGVEFGKTSLNITYRFKKKDGTYIKLLRQSSFFKGTEDGDFRSNLSLLTDISFIENSDIVHWDFIAPEIEQESLKKKVYEEFSNLFSNREKNVIDLLHKNFTSNEIAEKLYISPHTVITHRKNILRKAQCTNTEDLISFCHKVGVL